MAKDILYTYLNDNFIGTLEKDDKGGFNFQYDDDCKIHLSLSLPVRKEIYTHKECVGFFNGLLSESENTRIAIGRKYHINPKNDFAILKAIGYDCAGAVAFFTTKQTNLKEYYEIKANVLSDNELEEYINNLPTKPLTLSQDKRLSLAGAQDKTAVI